MDRKMERQVEIAISHEDTCTALDLSIVWLRKNEYSRKLGPVKGGGGVVKKIKLCVCGGGQWRENRGDTLYSVH